MVTSQRFVYTMKCWKKDTESQFWNADYLLSAETRQHLDRENEVMKGILTELGLAK